MPEFNKAERSLYFYLTAEETLSVKNNRTVKSQIYFIRLLGYFKAKHQFYKFALGADHDSQYILEKYFEECISDLTGQLDFKTYQKQKNDLKYLIIASSTDSQRAIGIG